MTDQKQTEITPCLETANNYIIHLQKEIDKRDKQIRLEQYCSSELAACATRERSERLSQEKKSETSLICMIVSMVLSYAILVYIYLF